jgi:hypothetical protein
MYTDDGSSLGASVDFEARRAEHMSTGQRMFWAFEKTTPANATIMEINSGTFTGRLLKEFQQIGPMQLCCSNLLRLSLADTISQLAEEMFKSEINSSLKFFLIVLK